MTAGCVKPPGMTSRSGDVDIHLMIPREQEDVQVDFKINTRTDTVDGVVAELVGALNLEGQGTAELRQMVMEQMQKARDAVDRENPWVEGMSDASEECLDDPEYAELVRAQKRALEEMDARHAAECDASARAAAPPGGDDLLIFN